MICLTFCSNYSTSASQFINNYQKVAQFSPNRLKMCIMKNIILILFVGVLLSCNRKEEDSRRDMLYITDTTGLNRVNADTAVVQPVAVAPSPRRTTSTRSSGSTHSHTGTASNNNSSSSSGTGTTTSSTKKQGWSKAAKGAVIGGVAGAATGAVITKSGKGAIIGGVIGAGGGYIIGRSKDRKDGRVGN